MKTLSVYPPAPLLQATSLGLTKTSLLTTDFNYSLRFGQVGLMNEDPFRISACAVVAGYVFGFNENLFTDNQQLLTDC